MLQLAELTFSNKLAIVIATKDRPDQLRELLSCIREQSFRPHQIIVVDGGDPPVSAVVKQFPELPVDYKTVHPPALTRQKNAGVSGVKAGIELVGFIDDDVRFERDSFAAMMAFWEQATPQTAGASFNLADFNSPWSWLKSLPQRVFFIDNREFGRVLRSGFNTPIWNVRKDTGTQWLGGGYTVWRKDVFNHWQFDEWFVGSGLWEDVHFSYRVGKRFQLAVVADARAAHLEPPGSASGQLRLGKTQVVNWVYFVKNNPDLSILLCLWACVGRTATNLAKGLGGHNLGFILRALGNSIGLLTAILGMIRPCPGREGR